MGKTSEIDVPQLIDALYSMTGFLNQRNFIPLAKDDRFGGDLVRYQRFIKQSKIYVCSGRPSDRLQIKIKFSVYLSLVPVRSNELRSSSPQLAQRHTIQGCTGGESMVTCVHLTDSGFETRFPRQKARTSTNRPCGRFWICK